MEYWLDYTKKPDERVFSSEKIEWMPELTDNLVIEMTIEIMEKVQRGGSLKECSKNVPQYSKKYREEYYLNLLVKATSNLRVFLHDEKNVRWSHAKTPVYNSELIIGKFRELIGDVFTSAVKHLQIIYATPLSKKTTDLVIGLIVDEMCRLFESHHYIFKFSGRAIAAARRNGYDY
jgi:hypothetical protein